MDVGEPASKVDPWSGGHTDWGSQPVLPSDTGTLTGYVVKDGVLRDAACTDTTTTAFVVQTVWSEGNPLTQQHKAQLTNASTLTATWKNDRLLAARIGHITNFSKEQLAKDLHGRRIWTQVTGMSIARSKTVMEIEFNNIIAARELLAMPLNTHGISLPFTESLSNIITVSPAKRPIGVSS